MKEIQAKRIIEILNNSIEGLDLSEDQLDDDLREHGMDSIKFITLIVALEAEYRCEIPDEKLLIPELNTVRKIIDVLNSIEERFEEN